MPCSLSPLCGTFYATDNAQSQESAQAREVPANTFTLYDKHCLLALTKIQSSASDEK